MEEQMKKKIIKKRVTKKKEITPMTISNCNFTAVKWDDKAIKAIENVSEGLRNLTRIFNGQNIHIDCMMKIEQTNEN